MAHYRHLFFDLDNTVWDFNRNSRAALQETFVKFSLDTAIFNRFFETYTFHNDRLWDLYRRNEITKKELSGSRFELTFRDLHIQGVDGTDFNHEYLAFLPFQTRLCDGALPVLEKLSEKYAMYIITNGFREVQFKKLAYSGLDPFFRKIFISEEIKAQKPSTEIFRYALKSCNARKRESLMIGDSWEVDVVGAMKAGIDQVHYAPFHENNGFTDDELLQLELSSTKTFRINRLNELLTFL